MYADIIVDITHEKLDKVFQYRIPSHLEGMLKVGMEVVVPFGMGNKEIKGYVTRTCGVCTGEDERGLKNCRRKCGD